MTYAVKNIRKVIRNNMPLVIKNSHVFSKWVTMRVKNIRNTYRLKNLDLYNHILPPEDGNLLISNRIADDQPLMISRFGNVESVCVFDYLAGNYSEETIKSMITNAGFFPSKQEYLDKYSQLFLESSKSIDVLGVWFNYGEAEVIRNSCPQASLVDLDTLEPYYHDNPWSLNLKSKKILVIHPFANTILEQYNNHRQFLFQDENILPQFELSTMKAVQSIGGTQTEFSSWFDAYFWMCEKIKQYDFDIAIIGCGAYGLPLAAYVKSLGKKAIHLGGVTQILFGIKGQRWDSRPFFQSLYNEYWVRPKPEETPQDYKQIENGCYW
ncbi:hypothetical protein [Calothrix rhizosoleniae]|uniref:hypothetical protein n=1 Tax=Calothrix rhizosoleniae TaxID=888997 RepID=UPI000B4A434D|nr:hypothetical protein [Calothrix rhizosoleniae]